MGRMFTYRLSGDPGEKLSTAKREAARQGYSIQGDTQRGVVKKGIVPAGSYVINGRTIEVTINIKPPGWGWDDVDDLLRQFLGD
jgi:hypothetical protein